MIIWKSPRKLPRRKPDYCLYISAVPPTLNKVIHVNWKVYNSFAHKWTAVKNRNKVTKSNGFIANALIEQFGTLDDLPYDVFDTAYGRFTFLWPRARDRVNWAFGIKWIEDALQYTGIIKNDAFDVWFCQVEWQKVPKEKRGTIVEVWNGPGKPKRKTK